MRLAWIGLACVTLLAGGCSDGGGGDDGPPGDPTYADASGDGDGDGDGDTGPPIDPTLDTDGDGLPDAWEVMAGDDAVLDRARSDSDGDGLPDGDEDPDGDGLTNLQELSLSRLHSVGADGLDGDGSPDPLRPTLIVELDAMAGVGVDDAVLRAAAASFDDLPTGLGIDLHFYRDQADVGAVVFDGSFGPRHAVLRDNGPSFDDLDQPPIPYDRMIHVVVARQRTDEPSRGGDTVADGGGDVDKTGVLLYMDALADVPGQCGDPITLPQASASTLAHELGHVLQLGHDTSAGGGINYYNVMSVPMTCLDAHARFRGDGNDDPALGATEAVGASRFSAQAVALMALDDQLSVDTAAVVNGGDGNEM